MTKRIPLTELLCVHCPAEQREHLALRLRQFHPTATFTFVNHGWIVVESSLGAPASPLVGSRAPIRFSLGEDDLLGSAPDRARIDGLAWLTRETPHALAQFPGDFCFVVLGEHGVASAVRSCSGVPRLFAFHQAGVTVVGTRLEWVARVFPSPLELDARRLVCDDHALGIAPDHGSAISGITIIPVGHVGRVGRWATPRVVRYWSPETLAARNLTSEEISAEVRDLVRQELTRHLDPDHSNAMFFSGGLDSSLVTALCAELDAPLDGVTILPPSGHPALTRERFYSQVLAKPFRNHLVYHLDPNSLLQELAAHSGALCAVASSEWQALQHLRETPRTVITGWFADECFGHVRLPELFRRPFPSLGSVLRACSLRDATVLWYRRRRAGRAAFQTDGLVVPELFHPTTKREFAGWLRAATWMPRPERRAERLLLHRRLTDIAGAYAEAAAHLDARVVAPFASRAMVELATQLDPAQLFDRGLAKAPLRRLASRHLPKALAERPDKGDWGLPQGLYPTPRIPPELLRVLDMDYLQAHPTLSLDEVGTLLWVTALERGRVRIEHDRQAIWNR